MSIDRSISSAKSPKTIVIGVEPSTANDAQKSKSA